ncbi:ATP-binding cassette domain-containing protein [Alteromonadaceae bacterium M269]|nr:ATP-binding cassette domain-containing protein [Alteromonadaceae bacterium M269]
MASVFQLKNASLQFGNPPILDAQELVIQKNERICLVGRNGCGKSTLLRVISGEMKLDDGQRIVDSSVVISLLPQDPPQQTDQTLFDYVAQAVPEVGELLSSYHKLIEELETESSEQALKRMQSLQQEIDHLDAWKYDQRIEQVLSSLKLDGSVKLNTLSGGWRRKAALARALLPNPDILLLDEPTNHLDISMIEWLENTLLDYRGSIVFVSHDRRFIRNLASRIVDLDRGIITSYPGSYQAYLEKKEQDLKIEEHQNHLFDKVLSKEEAWIRQGIKARRTRNEGRVRALKALRNEFSERRNRQGKAKIKVTDAANSGKMVFVCDDLHYDIEDKTIVDGLDLILQRGDKLGLIGPNGCGKSTLIKLLLGELEARSGTVKRGTALEVAYFDQHREALDYDKTVIDVVADGKREVTINGHSKHVISVLQDYLFTPERVNVPVHALSGGEKNRLLLAKLLIKPSNLLILDEPTNDLDIETLELLEDVISQYNGTLILVSHDREFVDNVVTSCLLFDGKGKITDFVGGFAEIEHWQKQQIIVEKKETSEKIASPTPKPEKPKAKKLSYKFQLELEKLPETIDDTETSLAELQERVNSPDFFKQDKETTDQALRELSQLQDTLDQLYARWDELEEMKEQ